MSYKFELPPMTDEEERTFYVLKNYVYPGCGDEAVYGVMLTCQRSDLDPTKKFLHIVPMWDSKEKRSVERVMPGITYHRAIAHRHGCAGISEPEFGPTVKRNMGGVEVEFPEWCKMTVSRRDKAGNISEFHAFERWVECYSSDKDGKPTAIWKKRPWGMLRKTTEAAALRAGFPDVVTEYTTDEMGYDEESGQYAPPPTAPVQAQNPQQAAAEKYGVKPKVEKPEETKAEIKPPHDDGADMVPAHHAASMWKMAESYADEGAVAFFQDQGVELADDATELPPLTMNQGRGLMAVLRELKKEKEGGQ